MLGSCFVEAKLNRIAVGRASAGVSVDLPLLADHLLAATNGEFVLADIEALAREHGMSAEAVRVLAEAVRKGGGHMAQFSHPELGGMGQWSAGGMTQVGDMFNTGLRDNVAALCAALAGQPDIAQHAPEPAAATRADWWPQDLGQPSSSGGQNGMRYACFPDKHRVATEQAGVVTLYDSGAHRISGVSQAQGSRQTLHFSSQLGTVRAEDLPVVR